MLGAFFNFYKLRHLNLKPELHATSQIHVWSIIFKAV